jgi:hypothetical protein
MIRKLDRPKYIVVAWHDWFDWMASSEYRDQFCNIATWFIGQQMERRKEVNAVDPDAFESLIRETTSHILAAYEEFLKPEYRRCLKKEIR